jgi:hypothetical protein
METKVITIEQNAKTSTLRDAPLLTPEQAEELRRLLAESSLTSEGFFKQGQTVDVMVTVWESEEKEGCLDVLVSAFQPGVGRLNMGGLRVSAQGQTPDATILRVGQLHRRGGITIKDLPVGVTYHLRLAQTMGRSAQPIPFLNPVLTALAARTSETDNTMPLPEPLVYQSTDGRLRATLRQTASDTTVVAVETNEASLAGAVVRFAFVQESGKIELSDTVTLKPVEGEEGLWEGRWEGAAQLAEPCEFVFEVIA